MARITKFLRLPEPQYQACFSSHGHSGAHQDSRLQRWRVARKGPLKFQVGKVTGDQAVKAELSLQLFLFCYSVNCLNYVTLRKKYKESAVIEGKGTMTYLWGVHGQVGVFGINKTTWTCAAIWETRLCGWSMVCRDAPRTRLRETAGPLHGHLKPAGRKVVRIRPQRGGPESSQ